MSGTKASWTPERRAAQAERARKQMADPARREQQAGVMRQVRADPKHEAKRLERRWSATNRKAAAAVLETLNRDPAFVSNRVMAAVAVIRGSKRPAADPAKARAVRLFRVRGDEIPPGYEDLYAALMRKHAMVAEEALRLVLAQRTFDLRNAA